MQTFTVHEMPSPAADRVDRADALEFVKDGFSWPTAMFPPLGFLGAGLWLAAIAYFVAMVVLILIANAMKMDDTWLALIIVAIHVFLAFEMPTLRRWLLDRRGWRTIGVVNGSSLEDCERRFLESWLPEQPAITVAARGAQAPQRTQAPWRFGAKA